MSSQPAANDVSVRSAQFSPWRQLAADGILWLVLVGLLLLFRAILVWIFRAQLPSEGGLQAMIRCFATGLRFDISIATYAILPSLVLTVTGFIRPLGVWQDRARGTLTAVLLSALALVFVADVGYFAEYGDQFNHWVFGLLYDDRTAIWQTVWKTYPVVALVLLSALAVSALTWAVNRVWRTGSEARLLPGVDGPAWIRASACCLVLALAAIGLRGSFGRRPVQLKDAATTGDVFLNKLVLNPVSALRYAISEHRRMQSSRGLDTLLSESRLRAAAEALFPLSTNRSTLDECLERVAPGAAQPRPKHIFIVVMESYDSWAMQPAYASLHLTDQLAALGRKGIQVQAFVPASDGTMNSFAAFVAGLPFAGVYANYQPVVRRGVPTAAAPIFKRLGYRPRFFYTGYLSWQRVGEFCREQGFEEVYGGDQMSRTLTGDEWGVDDATLFRFILEHTGEEPTFNLVLTTSYHPPFSVNLEAAGFDVQMLRTNTLCEGLPTDRLRVLGHLWYSDKSLSDFVAQAEAEFGNPLFALTGDHYSRRGLAVRPTLYQKTSVPLVICGAKALEGVPRPPQLAGSHIDVLPTLVNLVAPPGFAYCAFGRDLLDPAQPQLGFGCETVVGPDFIVSVKDPTRIEDLQGRPLSQSVPAENLVLQYRQLHALSWWRSMKGKEWPDTPRIPR